MAWQLDNELIRLIVDTGDIPRPSYKYSHSCITSQYNVFILLSPLLSCRLTVRLPLLATTHYYSELVDTEGRRVGGCYLEEDSSAYVQPDDR